MRRAGDTLSDRLREALEEEIVTGALQPGDRLEEVALAQRFAVSRTPIREALHQLAAAGLIENRPRRGALVAEIGPERLVEMFEVMGELEGLCARLAARRAGTADLAAIRSAHEACTQAIETMDVDAYYYRNEVFHERIRETAGNAFLLEQATALQRRLRPYRRLQLRARGRVAASFGEHEAIMAAIERGDADAAGRAMREHVVIQGERFADLVASLAGRPRLRA